MWLAEKAGEEMPISATEAPLTVSTDGTAGPYLIVTPEQYVAVTEALRADGVPFEADLDAVRLNGAPALAVIELGRGADVRRIQAVLDRVSADLQNRGRARRHPPPTWKELVVRGDRTAMQELRRRLAAMPVGGWTRRTDVEERFRKTLAERTTTYCFAKPAPPARREVAVLLQGRGPGEEQELYVAGVVPLEGREPLGPDQHDQVVSDFRATLIEPLVRDLNTRVLDYSVSRQPPLEDVLSPEALGRLRSFSAVASKGDLHQVDMRRWAAFIAQTHLDDSVIDLDLLAGWLEEDGFPPESRTRLMAEYEFGRRVLSAYDEERAS
jgi:hypothetical protein